MTKSGVLDLYFLDARARALDLAAFLDRVDRGAGEADFRLDAIRRAVAILGDGAPDRARRLLEAWSDPTPDPVAKAPGKGAAGAWPGK